MRGCWRRASWIRLDGIWIKKRQRGGLHGQDRLTMEQRDKDKDKEGRGSRDYGRNRRI